jgi:hypothetical protein
VVVPDHEDAVAEGSGVLPKTAIPARFVGGVPRIKAGNFCPRWAVISFRLGS